MSTENEQHADQSSERKPGHALPEGAERHPLVDLSRDPHPGKPDHAKPEKD